MTSYEFLITNATENWRDIMAVGGNRAFQHSADTELLESLEKKAAHLAATEAERLTQADLFHLSPDRSESARTDFFARRNLSPDQLPSESGYVTWSRPIARTRSNAPVVAAHWGPTEGGEGTWVAFWAALEGEHFQLVQALGWNVYEQESAIPHGTFPAQYMQAGQESWTAMLRALFNTWSVLTGERRKLKEVKAEVAQAKIMRQLGLKPRPVHHLL
ncbi:hypothetical protein [Streptomyces sp. NPDC050988]|uniref:hypothetical protein n=1 Tax=Streptomyces sp. NPDC050988 TaxID=3365637 RepID=UPI0037B566A8